MSSDFGSIAAFATASAAPLYTPAILPVASVWTNRQFRSNSATSKMLALMLAQSAPVDVLTGQRIDVGKSLSWGNDKEYHHLFPKAHLARSGVSTLKANAVANIILLTSHSNIQIRDRSPKDYLTELVDQHGRSEILSRLATNLVPEEALDAALENDYDAFLSKRAAHLQRRALALCGESEPVTTPPAATTDPEYGDDTDANPAE
jgi:hypothetical protein